MNVTGLLRSRGQIRRATFGDCARFEGAFGDGVSFAGAAFGDWARFDDTHFEGRAEFNGRSNEQRSTDVQESLRWMWVAEEAGVALYQQHEDSWKRFGSGPNRFLAISFTNAKFHGETDFSGRSVERASDFTNARFYFPPDLNAATNVARIDFTGAHIGFARPGNLFHWTSDTKVPVRLRAFRKIAEETKNHDLFDYLRFIGLALRNYFKIK